AGPRNCNTSGSAAAAFASPATISAAAQALILDIAPPHIALTVFPSYATPHVSAKPSRNQSSCNVGVLLNGAPIMSPTRSSVQKRFDNCQKSGRLLGMQPMSGIVDI